MYRLTGYFWIKYFCNDSGTQQQGHRNFVLRKWMDGYNIVTSSVQIAEIEFYSQIKELRLELNHRIYWLAEVASYTVPVYVCKLLVGLCVQFSPEV